MDLRKKITKIEAHAGMAERLVRDLAIEKALQEKIKHTLEHNHQSYGNWCALSYKDKRTTRFNLPLHTTWDYRRDPPAGDMTPPEDTPSSWVEVSRVSPEWSSIPSPVGSVTI